MGKYPLEGLFQRETKGTPSWLSSCLPSNLEVRGGEGFRQSRRLPPSLNF